MQLIINVSNNKSSFYQSSRNIALYYKNQGRIYRKLGQIQLKVEFFDSMSGMRYNQNFFVRSPKRI